MSNAVLGLLLWYKARIRNLEEYYREQLQRRETRIRKLSEEIEARDAAVRRAHIIQEIKEPLKKKPKQRRNEDGNEEGNKRNN